MSETDVTLVLGKPVGSEPVSKDSVSVKLQELNLKQYEQELIDEQGYDSVETLNEMSPDELSQLADDCKMKPGHKKKFLAAFAKTAEAKPVRNAAAEATETKPAEPAVNPNMIALQEQMAALKKQQSTDRLKKDFEEREKKIKEEAEMRQKLADMQMEQMKMQMQNNMNLNLASQNQAQAAAPIIINNNNNNNNNNNVTGGGNMAEAKTPAEKAAAEKAAAEKAAAEAKVFVLHLGNAAPASGLLQYGDRVLTINGVEVTDSTQAAELHKPAVGEVVFYVLRGKALVTVTMHKPQADMKLGVALCDVCDPALEKALGMMIDFCGFEKEKPEWKLMTSAELQKQLEIVSFDEQLETYVLLQKWLKVIRPAFAELAGGTSKSGTPKPLIDVREHPDYINAEDDSKRGQLLVSARGHSSETPSRLLCWDHTDYLDLATYPWFKEQPQYKSLFDLALAIKEGKLTKMNKAGKVEVAKQFIAAADAVATRQKIEVVLVTSWFGYMTAIQEQVRKVQLEEAQARAPDEEGCCCVVS